MITISNRYVPDVNAAAHEVRKYLATNVKVDTKSADWTVRYPELSAESILWILGVGPYTDDQDEGADKDWPSQELKEYARKVLERAVTYAPDPYNY